MTTISSVPSDPPCNSCYDSKLEQMILEKEARILEEDLKSITLSKHRLSAKLTSLLSNISKLEPISSFFTSSFLKRTDLLKYYQTLKLPSSLFEIVKNNEYSVGYMLQSGLLTPKTTCICGRPLLLFQSKYGELNFQCACSLSFPLFHSTVWATFEMSADQIILFIFLWILGLKYKNMRILLTIDKTRSKSLEGLLLDVISDHFAKTFKRFKGVVEIDESCFKHTTTARCKSQPERWVFGLYEREGKRNYMEVVSKRTASVLLPIIQNVCEPGTTIVSDQWPAYNKLAELGFPHYTVDHSRFFVNPSSREIHTQNIELSWCWAKYEIKKQNRALHSLQKYLHVYCWKRQFKSEDKESEIGTLMQEICRIMKEYQENYKVDSN